MVKRIGVALRGLFGRYRGGRLVVFFIALPDPLPIPDGAIFTFTHLDTYVRELEGHMMAQQAGGPRVEWAGQNFSSLRFWRTPVERLFWDEKHDAPWRIMRRTHPFLMNEGKSEEGHTDAREHLALELGAYTTVVEAVTPLSRHRDDAMTDAFEQCFGHIDTFVRAYRLYSRQVMPSLTRERLAPLIPYATRTLVGEPRWGDVGLFLLHENVGPQAAETLDTSELDVFNVFQEVTSRNHPFVLFAERSLDARVAFSRDGRFGDVVINIQTSIEVLLDALLSLLLWEEGMSPEEAARDVFSDDGFAKRVRTHFHARLGGDWRTESGGAMTVWAVDVARMRGRVVHSGYRPSREEAQQALDTAQRVEDFVRQRVAHVRTRYPRTALLLLGRPGLERIGVWSGQIREFAERAEEEPDWLGSFRDWRDALNDARST